MRYRLMYRASTYKDLRKITNKKARQSVVAKILQLADNPRPEGCTKLSGADNVYRVRQGDYRIVYSIFDKLLVVEVVRAGHRSDVYRA